MLARGQITVSNIDDGKTPFLHQAYKMKDGRFLKHYPVYEASPVNGYKEGDLWHRTDGSQPGYFVANKSNTTLNLNDWTFYANELAYSDTDKFYPKFEGTYSDYNEVASDDQTKYTWKIIKADDGIGIKSVKEYYAVSTSNVTPPSSASDWSETPKTTNTTNKYLWNYEVYTYSNGDVKETTKRVIGTHGTTGATGASGQSVTSITEEYYLSTSKTSQTGGSWKATPDPWTSGKYQWTRSKILYINPTKTEYTDPVIDTSWEAIDGIEVGGRNLWIKSSAKDSFSGWNTSGTKTLDSTVLLNGEPTIKFVSPSTSTEGMHKTVTGGLEPNTVFTYSFMVKSSVSIPVHNGSLAHIQVVGTSNPSNAHREQNMKYSPTSMPANKWTKVSVTFNTPVEAVTGETFGFRSYLWYVPANAELYFGEFKLEKGNKATDWTPAPEDTQQAIDSKVTETDVEYYLSTSSTTPTGGTWTTTAPPWVDGKFMWSRTKIVYGNGTTRYAPSATGTCIAGATGNTGNGIASVTNRYLATTLSTGVTTATSGWTTTVQKTDSVKKYLWNYEEILYTNGKKIPTAPVIIGTHGDKGDKGSTGVGIKNIQEFYLASPLGEGVTRSTDGWTSDVQVIDSDKKYLWNYEKINYDNNTNYLTAPVIIGTFGSQGIGFKGVTEYYLASPLSEGIRKDTNGWTTEIQPLTPENKYLWNKEIIHYTDDESALKDKTEVLSGTEIYTDKADADAVVHVEVDGKSYQHAGSGKNLITNDPKYWEIGSVNGGVDSGVNYPSTETLRSPYIELKKGSYTLSIPNNTGNYSVIENWFHTYDINKKGIGASGWSSELSRRVEIPEDGCFVRVLIRPNPRIEVSLSDVGSMFNIQLEEGSTATEYEPPVPTPDYPIEIHSLNDFDVVSQKSEGGMIDRVEVGGRNLLIGSKGPITSIGYPTHAFELSQDIVVGETYTYQIKGVLKEGSNYWLFYSENGQPFGALHRHEQYDEEKGVYYQTFVATSTTSKVRIYSYPNTAGASATIEWVKLEKGKTPTDWTPAPEDITEDSNHPLIDKINLSLSEPLRSVGDVCDRLMNKNGIWVIERNIELLHPEDGTRSIEETFGVRSNPLYENLSQEYQDKLNNLRSFKESNYVYTLFPDGQGGYY